MMLKGKPVVGGIGIGHAVRWLEHPAAARETPTALPASEVAGELARLDAAVGAARVELQALRAQTAARLGADSAAILDVHLLLLADPELVGQAAERIRQDCLPAPAALTQVGEAMAQMLGALDDAYLRERAADVRDVTGRIVRHLTGARGLGVLPAGTVLVAADVPPSDLLGLAPGVLQALVLTAGGETSHTAILARSLGIPTVMGLGRAGDAIVSGATVLVDGDEGLVVVDPAPHLLVEYRMRMDLRDRQQRELEQLRLLPAETLDGHRVQLAANIGSAAEAAVARAAGAEGVGLFRTEFLFLGRTEPPSEAEQYGVYKAALAAMAPHPVLIRTLDIGGDKPLPFLAIAPEQNPFLGLRGIRLCQEFVPLFRTQLRAILRAAAHGPVQVMVPMVTTRREVLWLRAELDAVRAELLGAGQTCGPVAFGIMIETPAAALMAAELAPLVDFFSIGTNDLTQYTLAVDRLNARVAGLYDALHPAVLRLIRLVVAGAHAHGRWVGVCGELAGDPRATALLVGLGVDELSMSALQLGRVKQNVRQTLLPEAVALAEQALAQADGEDVRQLLGISGRLDCNPAPTPPVY